MIIFRDYYLFIHLSPILIIVETNFTLVINLSILRDRESEEYDGNKSVKYYEVQS